MTTTTQASSRTRPYTGAEYLESIRDGREIWIYGEKVKHVTTHPAFRNTARMLARLYDALHAADAAGAAAIWMEAPPQSEDWRDVQDRLARAASVDPGEWA